MAIKIPSNCIYENANNNKVLNNKISSIKIEEVQYNINPNYQNVITYGELPCLATPDDLESDEIIVNQIDTSSGKWVKNTYVSTDDNKLYIFFQLIKIEITTEGTVEEAPLDETNTSDLLNTQMDLTKNLGIKIILNGDNGNLIITKFNKKDFVPSSQKETDGTPTPQYIFESFFSDNVLSFPKFAYVFIDQKDQFKINGYLAYVTGIYNYDISSQQIGYNTASGEAKIAHILTKETQKVQIGNVNPFSLETTEFVTNRTTFNNIRLSKSFQTRIKNSYEKGKETAELLLSISEYYDYDSGKLSISTVNTNLPSIFKIGDKVIPMKFTNGGDKPMSLAKDGSAKIFKVVGIEPYFDGAVWQRITIQEF